MGVLVSMRLGDFRGEWSLEEGVVKYVEYFGGDAIEAELDCKPDDRDCILGDVLGRLASELKLLSPVLGAIKVRLKYLGFPISIEMRGESMHAIVEFRGVGEGFQLIIRYQVT